MSIPLILLALLLGCQQRQGGLPEVGKKAPDFTLYDADGREVRLSDFEGKVVLIDFWATWCPPCQESLAELESLSHKFRDSEIVIIGISLDNGSDVAERVKSYIERNRITYRILIDNGNLIKTYGIRSIPTAYLLDREHRIARHLVGFAPGMKEELSEQIERLL